MRCPMCHRLNAATAWRCGCGHELGPAAAQVRARLRDQQTSAWIALALLALLDAVAAGGGVHAALQGFIASSALGFTALVLLTARAVQRVRIARARVRLLAGLDAGLPRAVVRRR